MKRRMFVLFVAAFAVVLTAAPVFAQPAMSNNVVLIGWDGADRNHVKALLAAGVNWKIMLGAGCLLGIGFTM